MTFYNFFDFFFVFSNKKIEKTKYELSVMKNCVIFLQIWCWSLWRSEIYFISRCFVIFFSFSFWRGGGSIGTGLRNKKIFREGAKGARNPPLQNPPKSCLNVPHYSPTRCPMNFFLLFTNWENPKKIPISSNTQEATQKLRSWKKFSIWKKFFIGRKKKFLMRRSLAVFFFQRSTNDF